MTKTKTEKTEKVVVILSGGIDSATVLGAALEVSPPSDVYALNFAYGARHNARERESAQALASHYALALLGHYREIDLPFIASLFRSHLLLGQGTIPHGHYEDEIMRDTVVPFRNGVMLSIAVGWAESVGARVVLIGNHAGDHAIYPDCRPPFIEAFSQAAQKGTYEGITVRSPFLHRTKAEIVAVGASMRVPYELTYSCYEGRVRHCGQCGTCIERAEAFQVAEVPDPTSYAYDERRRLTSGSPSF